MVVTITLPDAIFEMLKEYAAQHEPLSEDFCIEDCAGGNQDDAYYLGERRGSQWLAMSIVENIFNETEEA